MSEQQELIPNEQPKRKTQREKLTTRDGTGLDIAVSSLIKELRRGNEWEALYWARELEQRYYRYLWRRLLIFCAEDVGLANPEITAQVVSLREAYMITNEESKTQRGDYNFVAMAIYLLARSPKNKDVGFAHMIMHEWITKAGWKATPPDYAIDLHTAEGRRRRPNDHDRGRHWFTQAQIVTNREGPMDYEAYWARMFVRDGLLTYESVEEYIRELDAEGMLEHGIEGIPFLPSAYIDPATGELIDKDGPDAMDLKEAERIYAEWDSGWEND